MKNFKNFIKQETKSEDPIVWHTLKTIFGKHSQEKEPVWHTLKTVFGKHSQEKEPVWHTLKTVFGKHSQEPQKTQKTIKESIKDEEDHWVHNSNKVKDKHLNPLYRYTEDSRTVNNYLHERHKGTPHHNANKETLNHIHELDRAFADKKQHIGSDHVVYTGLHHHPLKHLTSDEGEHFRAHLPAFTSTSTDRHIARDFAKVQHDDTVIDKDGSQHEHRHVLKIHVPAHHPSISLANISKHSDEKEVLLHRGTRLWISKKPTTTKTHLWTKDTVSIHTWHAHVIGHEPDKL